MPIRHVALFAAGLCSACLVFAQASGPLPAAAYPSRTVTLVVSDVPDAPFAAVAKAIAPDLGAALGQAVVVQSRSDAAATVARAAPDGYTLLLSGSTLAIDSAVRPASAPDAQKDFAPVSLVATFPYVLVAASRVKLDSVQDVVAIAKASPGRIACASPGAGSGGHLACELFKSATSVHLRHEPRAGMAAAVAELVAGRAEVAFLPITTAQPLLRARTATALAVTGPARVTSLPDVPTMTEAGVPGFDLVGWLGVLAPAGTGKSIVDRLNADVRKVVALPALRERIGSAVGGDAVASTPDAFRDRLRREVSGWSRLAREMSIRVE